MSRASSAVSVGLALSDLKIPYISDYIPIYSPTPLREILFNLTHMNDGLMHVVLLRF